MQWILRHLNRLLLTALLLYAVAGVLYVWQIQHYPALTAEQAADGIVILTGGEERVDKGLQALQDGLAKRALVSGVHKDVKLRELLALHHIPQKLSSQIDLGFGAIDTAGNAQETAKWVRQQEMHSVILVTSNYHMPRALLHVRAVLPADVAVYPLAVAPAMLDQDQWYQKPKAWGLLFLAYNKYLLTWPEIMLWRYKN